MPFTERLTIPKSEDTVSGAARRQIGRVSRRVVTWPIRRHPIVSTVVLAALLNAGLDLMGTTIERSGQIGDTKIWVAVGDPAKISPELRNEGTIFGRGDNLGALAFDIQPAEPKKGEYVFGTPIASPVPQT